MSDLVQVAGEIYTKETTAGSDKCLIVPARCRAVMSLNLINWSHIKVGMFLSTTSNGDPNSTYSSPGTVSLAAAAGNGGYMGLFSKAQGEMKGDSEAYGYHVGGYIDAARSYEFSGVRTINATGTSSNHWNVLNAGSVNTGTGGQRLEVGNPSRLALTSDFASFCLMDIRRQSGTTYYKSQSTQQSAPFEDFSLENLLTQMETNVHGTENSRTAGYHEEETPYLLVQWPFTFARLRIHSWRVEVLDAL